MKQFLRVTTVSAAVAAVIQAAAWTASRRAERVNVVDVAWGPGLAGIAVAAAAAGRGDRVRRGLSAGAVTIWAARLATHIHRGAAGRGEDPRYEHMLEGASPARRIVKVFVTQGAAQWWVGLPMQIAAVTRRPSSRGSRAGLVAGTALMVVGGTVEVIADRQKARWKANPSRGRVMDSGLWSYSRHPNYLGDCVFWWGNYVLAASGGAARWAILSPAAMTWFLVIGTGAKPAERLRANDPDYTEYRRRVSFFLPRPPKAS